MQNLPAQIIKARAVSFGLALSGVILAVLFSIGLILILIQFKLGFGEDQAWEDSKLYQLIEAASGSQLSDFFISDYHEEDLSRPESPELKRLDLEIAPAKIPAENSIALSAFIPTQLPIPLPAKALAVLNTGFMSIKPAAVPHIPQFLEIKPPLPATAIVSPAESAQLAKLPFNFTPPTSFASLTIHRALLALDVEAFEPINVIDKSVVHLLPGESKRLYWFNEVLDSFGETLFHSWYYGDTLMSKVAIDVGSNSWRASNYQILRSYQQGQWQVVTESASGAVLASRQFEVRLAAF